MIKKVVLVVMVFTIGYANPYKNLPIEEKLFVLTNYFIEQSLKAQLPEMPTKSKPKEQDINYEPTKYELNYNYVQRIKAIKEAQKQEQKEINDKYAADVYNYNSKLSALSHFYKEDKNFLPIVEDAFNKALKVIYGKPVLNIKNIEENIQFYLEANSIYNENEFIPKEVIFDPIIEPELGQIYQECEVNVSFIYEDNSVVYDEVSCNYQNNIYRGKLAPQDNEKIKLNVKRNDDIFQQIVLEDKNR